MKEAHAEYEAGTVAVEIPYEPELIERMKAEIPWYGRKWNPGRKMWVFTHEYWDEARRLIEEYFPVVD